MRANISILDQNDKRKEFKGVMCIHVTREYDGSTSVKIIEAGHRRMKTIMLTEVGKLATIYVRGVTG